MLTLRNITLLLIVLLLTACQSLPEGISYRGEPQPTENIEFLADLTYLDGKGKRQVEQEIFDTVFSMIDQAERFILIDMFLYNDFQGPVKETTRAISEELTAKLIQQKQRHPNIEIIVITDPVNNVYGGMQSEQFKRLRESGIEVVITNLDALRDSNTVYSPFWRLFIKPFKNSKANTLPNPLGEGRVSVRSYLKLLNFKANHRKIIIADSGKEFVGLVTSANPHDGSSAHGNVAVKFSGTAVNDLLTTEKAVLAFSGADQPDSDILNQLQKSTTTVQVITESKIKDSILESLKVAQAGDSVDLAMFYLSNREVIEAFKQSHLRGVATRVLLDPNKDAFGRDKNGIPNRQVAYELNREGIPIRWCDTHGEQCHAKMLLANYQDGSSKLILGSANFTRRNLDDFNLETNVAIQGPQKSRVFVEAQGYFDLIWNNAPGKHFSVDYEKYEDQSLFKRGLYRFMEGSGISTF